MIVLRKFATKCRKTGNCPKHFATQHIIRSGDKLISTAVSYQKCQFSDHRIHKLTVYVRFSESQLEIILNVVIAILI